MLGIVLAITAACCWSIGGVLARLGLKAGINTATGTFISVLASLLLVGSLAFLIHSDDVARLPLMALLWFGLIGIVNFVLGRRFNYIAISRIGVTRAAPLLSAAPLFALILAVTFIGESINPAIIIGTISIVSGLYLVVTN